MILGYVQGHGTYNEKGWLDSGATNGSYYETYVARDILIEVGKLIEGKIKYYHISPKFDTKLCTQEAIDKKCDYFINLHHNSATNPYATWTEGYYWQTDSNKAWTKSLVENLSVYMPPNNGVSNNFGVQGQKYRANFLPNTTEHYAFLELGFISNDYDCIKLTTRKVEIAKQIVKSIEYFSGIKILDIEKKIKIILNTWGDEKEYAIMGNLKIKMPMHPVELKGQFIVDLRFITDFLGAKITYNPNTKGITITKDLILIELSMEGTKKQYIKVNGVESKMPYSLIQVNERNMIHVGTIAKALGAQIEWNPNTKQIILTK